jgi:Tfp pilus assembly protein PilE
MKPILRQQGMTLLMALIMLVVLTLLALTSFNLGKSNMQVVSNMQQRDEAIAAAREVIEETISTKFYADTASVLASPCNGVANTRCIDINGDGVKDVTVELKPKPVCIKAQAVKTSALDLEVQDDKDCLVGMPQGMMGVAGAVTGNSLCANSVWEVKAVATDNVTQASVEVTQGIAVRVPDAKIKTNCP